MPDQDAAVFTNEGIRVRTARTCRLCGNQGQSLYAGLRDRLFDAPGVWSLLRCDWCTLVWLDPQPIPEDIPKLYETYITHRDVSESSSATMGLREKVTTATVASTLGYYQLLAGRRWIWAGRIAGAIPLLRDYATVPFMFLKASTGASLLDIGCGSGQFLAMMRDLGWEVEGVEPDPKSARIAQETRRLRVQAGAVEQADLPSQSKDVITMTHVIEHLPDPLAVLRRCYQILRPEGLLVVATPNVDSLLHRRFRRCWRGLEPPRHMLLFNPATLGRFAKEAGFEISTIRTVTRASREIYIQSSGIESESPYVFPNIPKRVKVGSWVFWFIEEMLRMASLNVGEEVVLRAMKPGEVDPKGLETRPGSGS